MSSSIVVGAKKQPDVIFGNLMDLALLRTGLGATEICEACSTINLGSARFCKGCSHKLAAFSEDERAQAANAVGGGLDRSHRRTDQERAYDRRDARSSSMAHHLAHRRLILFTDVPTMASRGSPLPRGRAILPISRL